MVIAGKRTRCVVIKLYAAVRSGLALLVEHKVAIDRFQHGRHLIRPGVVVIGNHRNAEFRQQLLGFIGGVGLDVGHFFGKYTGRIGKLPFVGGADIVIKLVGFAADIDGRVYHSVRRFGSQRDLYAAGQHQQCENHRNQFFHNIELLCFIGQS